MQMKNYQEEYKFDIFSKINAKEKNNFFFDLKKIIYFIKFFMNIDSDTLILYTGVDL